jgi:hypothetical protein
VVSGGGGGGASWTCIMGMRREGCRKYYEYVLIIMLQLMEHAEEIAGEIQLFDSLNNRSLVRVYYNFDQ